MLLLSKLRSPLKSESLPSSTSVNSIAFILIICFNILLPAQTALINSEKKSLRSQINYSNESRYTAETFDQLNRYDVKFYKLDLSVSKYSTEIAGTGSVYAKVQNTPVDTFVIELIDTLTAGVYMKVDSVKINGEICSFTHNDHLIKVPVDPPLPVDSYFSAEIYYYGNGHYSVIAGYNGINNGTAFNSSVTCTYSEPFWSRIWWPCKQFLNDKADSIYVFLTTESDSKAGSNGILTSVVPLPGDKVRYEWKSNYPIDYYLVSFAVGDYIENLTYAPIEETGDSILIQSYLFQNSPYLQMNLRAIERTKDYLQLYSRLFGSYPFKNEKYGYCLDIGSWGAMEHQTMTTIGYQALDTTAAFVYTFYLWYSAHELGHSWFGDNVTCATWQDIWINEGFASYTEYLASQFLESQARADIWMNNAHSVTKSSPGGSVFVPDEFANDESRILDPRLSYKKGAAILHMIRYEVGNDSLFFLALKNFQNEFKDSSATGLDFKNVLEAATGQDFTDFFNQWYFGEGYPFYNVTWTQVNDTLRIRSVQTTSTSVTPLFKMPMEYKLYFAGGDTTIKIYQNSNDQFFEFHFSPLVTSIVVDPSNWVIDQSVSTPSGIENNDLELNSFCLYQNFPNPFNPDTKIKFSVAHPAFVKIVIYDILGNEIETVINEEKYAGIYELNWNAGTLPSGIYFYKMQALPTGRQAGGYLGTKKMVVLK